MQISKRKMLSALCGAVLGMSLAILPFTSAAAASMKLRLGHEMPESHPYHMGAIKFAELVSEKSKGSMQIQIYPNGTLGKMAQLAEGMSMGTVDLALTNTMVLEKYNSEVSVLGLPYLFRDWNHLYGCLDSWLADELNKGLERKGISVLAYHSVGTIYVNSTRKVVHPSDMKGMKVRVQPGPSYVQAVSALNAVVTTTAFSEVYTALQMGMIDAQTQSISNVLNSKHYEVSKYIALNNFSFLVEPLSISMMTMQRLKKDQIKILKDAAYESALYQRDLMAKAEKDGIVELRDKHGVEFSQCNLDEWSAVLSPVQEKFPKWKKIIDRVRAFK